MRHTLILWTLSILSASIHAAEPPRGPREGPPPLPRPLTSFGAAISGDALYIYGGHIGKAHAHSSENLSDRFYRLNLAGRGGAWEELPMGTKLQGVPLVEHDGKVYRVGGLSMRNKPGEPEDLHSVDEFTRFDPTSGAWEPLVPLPQGRSSHDAAVLDGKLYVVGGWRLTGDDSTAVWAEHGYVANLNSEAIAWEPLPPQPFKHRALAVAATKTRLYAIGGLTDAGKPTNEVFTYDPKSRAWSKGPDFPAATRAKAFAVSAFGVDDTIWASAVDGRVYSLRDGSDRWTDTAYDLKAARFFHRIVPHRGRQLLFIGGANHESHLDTIEAVELATLAAPPVARLQAVGATEKNEAKGSTNWPGFRGDGTSRTDAKNLPLNWSDGENIAWTLELPGYGQSSPVVWNDKVFVTSIEGANQETLHVTCADLRTGKPKWSRSFPASQTVASSDFVSKAAPTPAADGDRLYAFFESGDLIALDHDGKTLWQRSLTKEYGPFKGNHGVGASVAQTADAVIVLADHDGPSYLLSVDKATGRNRWKVDREPRVSWSSPIVTRPDGGDEILISSNGIAEAYDAAGGERLWYVEGLKGNTVASPSADDRLTLVGSSDQGSCIAIGRDGKVRWTADGATTSNFGSPLVHRDSAYYVNKAGVVFRVNLMDGKTAWTLRLPGSCWASPMAAGDLVYFFCKDGQTVVLKAGGDEPVKVAESSLTIDGRVYGVAAVDGAIILRTGSKLIRVGP